MNRMFLSVFSFVFGMSLFSACTPGPKFYGTLEKVDQDSTHIIAHVLTTYRESSPSYQGMPSNESSFKFVDQAGKEHVTKGNCNCMSTILKRDEPKMLQYKVLKSDLAKGVYKVYLSDDETANKYKTIEIK